MTGRARFGDFLAAAHRHLDPANPEHGRGGVQGGADEAARSLYRTLRVMSRYLDDLGPAFTGLTPEARPELGPWPQALLNSRTALVRSARLLRPERLPPPRAPRPAASQLARRLDAAAVSLTAGRDLLQTHFAVSPDGTRRDRTEWAAAIDSPTATRAVLTEFAALSRQIARHGTTVAHGPAPDARTTADARRRLNAASQWLLTLDNAVRAAGQRQPVPERDRELLRAIPSTALPPSRTPQPGDPVPVLVQGVIDSAERLRRATWTATTSDVGNPVTITSLRWAARAGVATSDHNDILLRTLAQASGPSPLGFREDLLAAAEASGRARRTWLTALHSLDDITTDLRDHTSFAAQEARNLTWWTGRLAYADPAWTPASGPDHAPRPLDELAANPDDIRAAVAAIHHASDTLARLARADHRQIRTGEHTGRLLVPTRFLPERLDIPRPFGPAPHIQVQFLLSHYRDAGEASADATTAVSAVAETVRSPSRLLATAQAAVNGDYEVRSEQGHERQDRSPSRESGRTRGWSDQPGPVERTLLDLGVRRHDMLQRGAELDRASKDIILDAVTAQERSRHRTALNRSAGTAEVFNHVLQAGGPPRVPLRTNQEMSERYDPQPDL